MLRGSYATIEHCDDLTTERQNTKPADQGGTLRRNLGDTQASQMLSAGVHPTRASAWAFAGNASRCCGTG